MRLLRSLLVGMAVIAASEPARGRAADDGLELHMTVSGVTLEKTTLREAQRLLGPAEVRHNGGDAAASASGECYVGADGTTLVLVSSSEMGGDTTITEVQLVARGSQPDLSSDDRYVAPPEHWLRCAALASLSAARTTTAGGLRLGMTREDVFRLLGRPAESEEHRIMFTSETKVPMTPEQKRVFEADNGQAGDDFFFRERSVVIEFVLGKVAVIRLSQVTST